jgi:enhancing lycopene biosynthesis protein 2
VRNTKLLKDVSADIQKTGAIHVECPVEDYITDRLNKVITTPANYSILLYSIQSEELRSLGVFQLLGLEKFR